MQPIKHVYVQSPKQTVSDTDFKQGSLVNSAQAISHIKQSNAFLVCMAKQGSSFHARLHTRQVPSLLRDKSINSVNASWEPTNTPNLCGYYLFAVTEYKSSGFVYGALMIEDSQTYSEHFTTLKEFRLQACKDRPVNTGQLYISIVKYSTILIIQGQMWLPC